MHKMTKATAINKTTRQAVLKRDRSRCVVCGSWMGMPNAHFISRAQGGLGIEQNIVTLCMDCHRRYDQSEDRESIRYILRRYLDRLYPGFTDEMRVYHGERGDK